MDRPDRIGSKCYYKVGSKTLEGTLLAWSMDSELSGEGSISFPSALIEDITGKVKSIYVELVSFSNTMGEKVRSDAPTTD